jgi:hypothetical protein
MAVLFVCACGGTAPPSRPPQPEPVPEAPPANPKSDLIRVQAPQPGALVRSPLRVTGEARGTWFFEASFPVTLLDANGAAIVQTHAQAKGEWMTEAFVPFESELSFAPPATETGTLVLAKDNPSGLPEHADELRVPVRFASPGP